MCCRTRGIHIWEVAGPKYDCVLKFVCGGGGFQLMFTTYSRLQTKKINATSFCGRVLVVSSYVMVYNLFPDGVGLVFMKSIGKQFVTAGCNISLLASRN